MLLSRQQETALKRVSDWYQGDDPLFRLFGYAGTGKTMLAKHFAENCGNVMFAAYTGKAAHVLQEKGCPGATTIHKLIYHPKMKSKQRLKDLVERYVGLPEGPDKVRLNTLIEEEKKNVARPGFTLNPDSDLNSANLLIIDEASMIGTDIAEDLLSFGVKVLALGDPGQLPPVRGTGYFTNAPADYLLQEIHRQEKDSPIIKLATMAREGRKIPEGNYGESKVITSPTPAQALEQDQLLVGRNATRRATNRRIRDLRGFEGAYPGAGERVVCLRNSHDRGLLNGSQHQVRDSAVDEYVELLLSDGPVQAHKEPFEGKDIPLWSHAKAVDEFDYAYAMTVHKSQGSQWDKVMVIDESSAFRQSKKQWLYTAITRAAKQVTIVRL